ncbi:MAG: hypothetical protein ACLT63_05295 [Bacteroides xylanisolvens]
MIFHPKDQAGDLYREAFVIPISRKETDDQAGTYWQGITYQRPMEGISRSYWEYIATETERMAD